MFAKIWAILNKPWGSPDSIWTRDLFGSKKPDKPYSCLGCLINILVAFGIFVLFVVVMWDHGNHEGEATRSHVARVKTDLRSIATTIESYSVETGRLPNWSSDPAKNIFRDVTDTKHLLARQPTFALPSDFVTSAGTRALYWDPFAPAKHTPFCYYSTGDLSTSENGYILWSAGPDGDYDLTIDNISRLYPDNWPDLMAVTYNPTNGTTSNGDVYRFRQK